MADTIRFATAGTLAALLLATPVVAQQEDYEAWDGDDDVRCSKQEFGDRIVGSFDSNGDGGMSEEEFHDGPGGVGDHPDRDQDADQSLTEQEPRTAPTGSKTATAATTSRRSRPTSSSTAAKACGLPTPMPSRARAPTRRRLRPTTPKARRTDGTDAREG